MNCYKIFNKIFQPAKCRSCRLLQTRKSNRVGCVGAFRSSLKESMNIALEFCLPTVFVTFLSLYWSLKSMLCKQSDANISLWLHLDNISVCESVLQVKSRRSFPYSTTLFVFEISRFVWYSNNTTFYVALHNEFMNYQWYIWSDFCLDHFKLLFKSVYLQGFFKK